MKRSAENHRRAPRLLAALLLVMMTGCVQVERRIELNYDGSGKIVETIRLSDDLRARAANSEEGKVLQAFFEEKNLALRHQQFGKVSPGNHSVKKTDGRVRALRSEYAFKHINGVKIPLFPYAGENWNSQSLSFELKDPASRVVHYYPTGALVHELPLVAAFTPKSTARKDRKNPATPRELERLRERLPVVRAMLKDFRMSLKLVTTEGGGKVRTLYKVDSGDLDDDQTLLKILTFNEFPDTRFADSGLGKSGIVLRAPPKLMLYIAAPPKFMRVARPAAGDTAPKSAPAGPAKTPKKK